MKHKLSILFLIFLLGIVFIFRENILNIYSEIFKKFPQIEKTASGFIVEKIKQEIITPPPLRSSKESPEAYLTQSGTIYWTNIQRKDNNLPALTENPKLNAAARAKLDDMFKLQYFEHTSPSGIGAADLAENAGYKFIVIGENLALGSFKNDKELVQAWMDSPGHRANILNSSYQEIGVAVGKGVFEGETTWLAVQEFGRPLSDCYQPDPALKNKIEIYDNNISSLKMKIESLLREINNAESKRGSDYNEKVNEYNTLVAQYNSLVQESKSLVTEYNSQVRLFNECAAQ